MRCNSASGIYAFLAVIIAIIFSGCKAKAAHAEGTGGLILSEGLSVEKSTSVPDPELKKLETIFSSMTPRFREVVKISDIEAFLADLKVVLQEEKTFRNDDLSLYYLIDKKHNVGSDYVPKDLVPLKKNDLFAISRNDLSLRPEAYKALEALSQGALNDGIKLLVSSTYRSYKYQEGLFNRYVSQDGVELAERYSARPGTSQHQLGVAVDFGSITDDWGDTKMGKWVYEHASDYGWSLSFPQGYEDVTGYMWECWHFRYIGRTACKFQKKWFGDIQQFMFEFIDAWEKDSES